MIELELALIFTFVSTCGVTAAAISYILRLTAKEQEIEREYQAEIKALQHRVDELEAQVTVLISAMRAQGVTITAGDDVRIGGAVTGRDRNG